MQKREDKFSKYTWFLEGENRYGNFSVYRAELPRKMIEMKKVNSFIEKNKLSEVFVDLNEKDKFSGWELSIRSLLLLADMPVHYYKEVKIDNDNIFVIFNTSSRQVGDAILESALSLIDSGFKIKLEKNIDKIRNVEMEYGLDSISRRYVEEANSRNIPHIIMNRNPYILQFGYGSKSKKVWKAVTSKTLRIGTKLTANKFITNNFLKKVDIPVPESAAITNEDDLEYLFEKYPKPVVIKPSDSTVGKGVSMNITNISLAKKAYKKALLISKKVIIEEQVAGYYYRVTFVDGEMVACAKAFPAVVIGDGKSRLKKLIEEENKKSYRQSENKNGAFYKIQFNNKLNSIIESQGYKLSSVIKKDVAVALSFSGADGGEWIEDNASVVIENIELMKRALKMVGLNVAGIDILSKDISVPFKENGGVILEINAGPDINIHANVNRGEKIIVEKHILDTLFSENEDGRIPVISITGTNGKTTTSKLISHLINEPGKWTVGLTTSEDKYINGKTVCKGDKSGFLSARSLLMNPDVDVAILETCHILGIDKRGLGYDWSDASVITNLSGDHIGTFCTKTEEDLFDIKSVVAKRTKKDGYLILNADDVKVAEMANCSEAKSIYFSLSSENEHIKKSIEKGDSVYYLKDNILWEETDGQKNNIIDVNLIPITFNGSANFNIYNCLAALAAVRSVFGNNISINQLRERFGTFGISPKSNPGRFNVINKDGFLVVIDYAHNPDGYTKVIELAKKLPHKRLVGVIKSAGDRPDNFIKSLGKISGINFDKIYIKEPSEEKIRGKELGEVSNLLRKGVLESGFAKENIEIIHDEIDAVKKAMQDANEGDVILVFAHEIDKVIDLVEAY